MNNMSKNWKSILVYILIPVLLIGAVVFFANQQTSTDLKYSQVVSMFKNGEVSEFSLDLSSGNLVYKTFAKPKEEKNYSVPSLLIFLMTLGMMLKNITKSILINRLFMTTKQALQILG